MLFPPLVGVIFLILSLWKLQKGSYCSGYCAVNRDKMHRYTRQRLPSSKRAVRISHWHFLNQTLSLNRVRTGF
jgi:hypothetical protein